MMDGLTITGRCLMLDGLTTTEGCLMLDGLAITEGILMGVICSEHTIATYLVAVTKMLCLILVRGRSGPPESPRLSGRAGPPDYPQFEPPPPQF